MRVAAILAGWLIASAQSALADPSLLPALPSARADDELLLAGVRLDDRLIAVGARGHIIYSDDFGDTWKQAEVPVRVLLTAIDAAPDRSLWAAGHDRTILSSSDRGESWQSVFRDPGEDAPFLGIDAGGPALVAFGAYGAWRQSADSGQSWQPQSFTPDDPHYYGRMRAREGGFVTVGEFGTVIRRADPDAEPETLTAPYDGTLFGIAETKDAWISWGVQGLVFESTDQGESWQRIETAAPGGLFGHAMLADGTLVLVGAGGAILHRRGPMDWRLHEVSDRPTLADVIALEDRLVLFSELGVLIEPWPPLEAGR